MSMDNLSVLHLPDAFAVGDWLTLKDVCLLDSAICNRKKRAGFLQVISSPKLLLKAESENGTGCQILRLEQLQWVLKKGIHLTSLYLDSTADGESMKRVLFSLVYTRCFDMIEQMVFQNCAYIDDVTFALILSKCRETVRVVNIAATPISHDFSRGIGLCPKLEYFASNSEVSSVISEMVAQSCSFPSFKRLYVEEAKDTLTDAMVIDVASRCPNLEVLGIDHCAGITDTAIMALSEYCPKLRILRAQCVANITDASITTLARACPVLEKFYAADTGITDTSLAALCQYCPSLKGLSVEGCSITDNAVTAIRDKLPGLTYAYFGDCPAAIRDDTVTRLVGKCRLLEQLRIGNNLDITDKAIIKIAGSCPHLETLFISGCTKVTAIGLGYIARNVNLKNVHIGGIGDERLIRNLCDFFPTIRWIID